jgi:hypothetical protein
VTLNHHFTADKSHMRPFRPASDYGAILLQRITDAYYGVCYGCLASVCEALRQRRCPWRAWDGWHGACGNPFFNDGRMESVRNCIDYRPGCRRGLRRFGAITSNDVLLRRELQDDEDDRALRWKCRECGYFSITQLLQCVAQTCAVLQQKIDEP